MAEMNNSNQGKTSLKLITWNIGGYPLDIPFKAEEIQSVCDKLPNGKAGGLDELVYEHFKYGGSLMHQALTRIFNAVR